MVRLAKQNQSVILLLDVFLLLVAPLVFGVGAAVYFFVFYPLVALVFLPAVRFVDKELVMKTFSVVLAVARTIVVLFVFVSLLNSESILPEYSSLFEQYSEVHLTNLWSLVFHLFSQILMLLLLIKTYNSYFTYKYQTDNYASRAEVYVLEFYLFILAYICLAIGIQFIVS